MYEEKIIDVTGIELTPGHPDRCMGNGRHVNAEGEAIECCCDECDYLQLCTEDQVME